VDVDYPILRVVKISACKQFSKEDGECMKEHTLKFFYQYGDVG
jgi:hypothetical protein